MSNISWQQHLKKVQAQKLAKEQAKLAKKIADYLRENGFKSLDEAVAFYADQPAFFPECEAQP